MAAPQLPQPQHVAKSQLFQRAAVQVTAFPSGIAQQLSEIDGYHSGQSIGKEGKNEGNRNRMDEFSDKDQEQEEV